MLFVLPTDLNKSSILVRFNNLINNLIGKLLVSMFQITESLIL